MPASEIQLTRLRQLQLAAGQLLLLALTEAADVAPPTPRPMGVITLGVLVLIAGIFALASAIFILSAVALMGTLDAREHATGLSVLLPLGAVAGLARTA